MNDILQQLHQIDKDITLAINSAHCNMSDFVWQALSHEATWAVLYVIVALFLFRNLGWKRALISIAAIGLTILVCDQFSNFTKDYFERLRPCWDKDMVSKGLVILEGKGGRYGFFSAHAANALGFAICSSVAFRSDRRRRYRIYGALIILWAVSVGMSRVFVGKHFFGDVMTGLVIGLAAGYVFGRAARYIMKRSGLEPVLK
ncbi:MAG: phosphatase PAP2 family protein [Bacteroidales bacterium]|nr:phosphatase PAP2 family protein [Candidatus Cacconaster merdequi]